MRKHGADFFQIEQIDQAETIDELLEKERYHIQRLGTFTKTGHGYNMTLGGDGVFGFEFSEETKGGMAEAARATFADPAERDRQRQRQELFWTETGAHVGVHSGSLHPRPDRTALSAVRARHRRHSLYQRDQRRDIEADAKRVMAATADPG